MSSTLYQSLEKLANSIRTKKGITKKMTIQQMIDELGELHTLDQLYAKTMTGTLTVPSGITSLGRGCFSWFQSITKVELPDTLTSIGSFVFWWNTSLVDITIPTSVRSIGQQAFQKCAFTSITIPSSVTSLGLRCFGYCGNLKTVRVERSTPSTAGEEFILGCPADLKIYVPYSAVSAYQSAAHWSDYATQIYGY